MQLRRKRITCRSGIHDHLKERVKRKRLAGLHDPELFQQSARKELQSHRILHLQRRLGGVQHIVQGAGHAPRFFRYMPKCLQQSEECECGRVAPSVLQAPRAQGKGKDGRGWLPAFALPWPAQALWSCAANAAGHASRGRAPCFKSHGPQLLSEDFENSLTKPGLGFLVHQVQGASVRAGAQASRKLLEFAAAEPPVIFPIWAPSKGRQIRIIPWARGKRCLSGRRCAGRLDFR